jgi:beta propeller repeat protein
MKMKDRLYFVFASFLLLILFSMNAGADTAQGTETRITNYGGGKYWPTIYGDKIVWSDTRTNNWDIYMYDLSTSQETQITTSGAAQSPAISGDRIVWYERRSDDMYMYNLSTSTETQITIRGLASNPAIYGDRIVWRDFGNIFMYNLSTSTETRIATSGLSSIPAIYGDRIVWQKDTRNGNDDIYMYNLSTATETQIATNESYHYSPVIYGDRIVYEAYRNGNYDIYMYDLSTSKETQITTTGLHQRVCPAIYGDRIVWQDDRNRNAGIYMYNLSTHKETQIATTTDESSQYEPSIYGNRIVWIGSSNGSTHIYMFTLSELILPVANFTSNVSEGYAPLSVQFNDLSLNATGRTWNFGDGVISTDANPSHIYTTAGTFTANLTASNADGTDALSKTITVTGKPVWGSPKAKFTAVPQAGRAPLTVKFTDKSINAASIKWDFGDKSAISTGSNPSHTYKTTGFYAVKLTATNGNKSNVTAKTVFVAGRGR